MKLERCIVMQAISEATATCFDSILSRCGCFAMIPNSLQRRRHIFCCTRAFAFFLSCSQMHSLNSPSIMGTASSWSAVPRFCSGTLSHNGIRCSSRIEYRSAFFGIQSSFKFLSSGGKSTCRSHLQVSFD